MNSTADVEVKGSSYQVRLIGPSDEKLLSEGFERLSDETRRMRFFVATPRLSRTHLHYLTDVDQENHVALGVLEGEEPVALGRFIRIEGDPASADIAITVVDSHHRRGLGSFLLEALALVARRHGIAIMHLDVLAENEPMLRMLDRYGARRTEQASALVHLVLDTGAVPSPPGAEEILRLFVPTASVK